jgi:GntR family transcriptional regulator
MFFTIDPNNGVAIYDQIVRQVKYAIAEGTLRPGQLLPSVRALSQELTINPNTIQRAYLQLQADGAIEPLRGRGLAVRAEATRLCVEARRDLIAQRLRSVLSEALHAGFSNAEVKRIVGEQLTELQGNVPSISAPSPLDATGS